MNIKGTLTIRKALVFLNADVAVGGTKACSSIRISGTLASGIGRIVKASGTTALHSLVSHHIKQLQGALLAIYIRDVHRNAIRGVGLLDIHDGTGGIVVRDVVEEDDPGSLCLVEDSQAKRRSCMRDRFLPSESSPSRSQVGDTPETPFATLRATRGVLVACVVENNMRSRLVISITRRWAFPSTMSADRR